MTEPGPRTDGDPTTAPSPVAAPPPGPPRRVSDAALPPAADTPPARKRGRRPGDRDTRAEIVRAARAEFAAHGFDGTSLRGVARAADVDPALVHHYFDGKEDLFVHAARLAVDPRKNLQAVLSVPVDELGATIVARLLRLWESPMGRVTIRSLTSNPRLASAFGAMLSQIAREVAAIRFPHLPPHRRERLITEIQVVMAGLMTTRYLVRIEALASASRADLERTFGAMLQRAIDAEL